MRARWIRLSLVLLGLVAVFAGLRGVEALQPEPTESAVFTSQVVVVGVTGRFQPDATDRAVIDANQDRTQVGAVSPRTRYVGQCAAAGWTTLGAGRRAAVGEPGDDSLCTPEVRNGTVVDWAARDAAIRANRGDARLGALAGSTDECIAAVGPGAALAAAQPDGRVPDYRTASQYAAEDFASSCPLTLVDAGDESAAVIEALAEREDVTVIVAGIGPAPGSEDPGLQAIYRIGTTLPGWVTSSSTRREGVVTLNDLTRTLEEVVRPAGGTAPLWIDGAPMAVLTEPITSTALAEHLSGLAALSDSAPPAYLFVGLAGAVVVLALVGCLITRRFRRARLFGPIATVITAAMVLTGAVGWQHSDRPTLFVCALMVVLVAGLSALAVLVARLARVPAAVAAAGITVSVLTADAALGGVLQPGSLLNSRPIFGLRWYGFGNVTFAAYAAAGLVFADYVATRIEAAGHRRWATASVLLIGFGIVLCEGWPSMGSDFGGVIGLTPGVLWLALAVSGIRITWPKLLAIGGATVVAISAISVLDWLRGPDARSHLGNFVQRVVDGDAIDVVARKAVTSWETIASPLGIGAIIVGGAIWVLIFRYLAPRIEVTDLRPVAAAVLMTAFLGTVLNDGGISVWITVTGAFMLTCFAFWLDRVDQFETLTLQPVADG